MYKPLFCLRFFLINVDLVMFVAAPISCFHSKIWRNKEMRYRLLHYCKSIPNLLSIGGVSSTPISCQVSITVDSVGKIENSFAQLTA